MDLFFELLLTAAATLLVACLLAKLFSAANDPRRDPHDGGVGPAAVIVEEEEERIIEVDEVKVKEAPVISEGWVEVEKAPEADVKNTAWVEVEEGVPATLAPELFLGTVLEERKEEGEVGKMPRDLTSAPAPAPAAAATEAAAEDLGGEATAPREILGLKLEKETVQQRDLAAQVAPSDVLDAELEKQEVLATEAVVVEQRHLVAAEAAPAQVIDAGLDDEEEEGSQAVDVIPHELASDTVPDAVLDAVLEKQQQEEQVAEVDQHELPAEVAPRELTDEVARELAPEVAPRATPDEVARELVSEVAPRVIPDEVARELAAEVAPIEITDEMTGELAAEVAPREISYEVPRELASEVAPGAIPDVVAREEELKERSVEEVVHQLEQVQNKEEAQCELGPAEEASANMEFEEWEGIERSEVEKRFGAAAAFAASDAGAASLSKLDSDVQLQLQGLLKVAVDGPCYDSAQPLTLRPSSRAKWVSWQKLGNMHPETAMEKYMDLLSESIPRWMGDKTSSTKKDEADVDSGGAALTMTAHTSDPLTNQGNEGSTSIDEGPLTSPPNPEKGQSSGIPAE